MASLLRFLPVTAIVLASALDKVVQVRRPLEAEEIIHAGAVRFRVQLLSDVLTRIERLGPSHTWEDRQTFLVQGRSWAGAAYTRWDSRKTTMTVLSTQHYNVTFRWGTSFSNKGGVDISFVDRSGLEAFTCGADLQEVPAGPRIPEPSSLPLVWAFRDSPRMVPPPNGPIPPNASSIIRVGDPSGLHKTSGFDLSNLAPDAYFFVPRVAGYTRFREQLLKLIGPVPVLPDYAFGTWFSWNHNYTQAEKQQEVIEFAERGFPLDVSGIDYDWRKHPCYWKPLPYCINATHDDEVRYEVNALLIPELRGLTTWLHDRNISVFLNDHPMKPGVGYDELTPKEILYRWHGLTSFLEQGVDFWWFDCHWSSVLHGINCSGRVSNPDSRDGFSCTSKGYGIDYVAWEKYVQFEITANFNREYGRLGPTMQLGCSNSNHLADHRYPIWWTGDNRYTQLSQAIKDMVDGGLQLKPYVHPDCAGHGGPRGGGIYEHEVYIRWVQFCSLGSILRLHSNPVQGRQPWLYGEAAANVSRGFMRLRLGLLPMLVAAGRRATEDGTPITRRLDIEFPEYPDASSSDQYLLGDDLLVAPIDPWANGGVASQFNRQRFVWIPPGQWEDAWTGSIIEGPLQVHVQSSLGLLPLYHRRPGLLLCADPRAPNGRGQDWSRLFIEAFPGNMGSHAERVLYDTRRPHWEYSHERDGRADSRQQASSTSILTKIRMMHLQDGWLAIHVTCLDREARSRTTASKEAGELCARDWVVRVHLQADQRAIRVQADNNTLRLEKDANSSLEWSDGLNRDGVARVLSPLKESSSSWQDVAALHGVSGMHPPPSSGEIVEITLRASRELSREINVQLYVGIFI